MSRRKPTTAPPTSEAPTTTAPSSSPSSAAPEVVVASTQPQLDEGNGVENEPVPAIADGIERETTLEGIEPTSEEPEAEALEKANAEAAVAIVEPLPDLVNLPDGRQLVATRAGLPNTCTETGEPCTDRWFAQNDQAARAGLGLCENAVRAHLAATPDSDG